MSNKQQLLIVVALFLGLGLFWFLKQDPVLNNINAALKADTELQAYPYQFRALKVDNGTATLTSPRSPQVSVLQFFKIAQPKLDINNPDSPTVIDAQKALAHVQEHAGKLAKAQPGITDIQWEIDRSWYASHGLIVE